MTEPEYLNRFFEVNLGMLLHTLHPIDSNNVKTKLRAEPSITTTQYSISQTCKALGLIVPLSLVFPPPSQFCDVCTLAIIHKMK
jgi:hypothetical protein